MQKTTFIYALCEPGTRTVRYIGKSCNPGRRLKEHLKPKQRKAYLGNWLLGLRSLGKKPNLVVLREVPEMQWEIAEERYIRLARGLGMKLVNGTDGGEGVTMTPRTRAKISAANSGDKHHMFGKTTPPETCAKIRASTLGKKNHNFGKTGAASPAFGRPSPFRGVPRTPEICAKISASNMGVPKTPEHCKNISAATLGEKNSMFGKTHTPEARARQVAAQTGKKRGPYTSEHRLAISAGRMAAAARRKERDQEIEWALAPYTLTD